MSDERRQPTPPPDPSVEPASNAEAEAMAAGEVDEIGPLDAAMIDEIGPLDDDSAPDAPPRPVRPPAAIERLVPLADLDDLEVAGPVERAGILDRLGPLADLEPAETAPPPSASRPDRPNRFADLPDLDALPSRPAASELPGGAPVSRFSDLPDLEPDSAGSGPPPPASRRFPGSDTGNRFGGRISGLGGPSLFRGADEDPLARFGELPDLEVVGRDDDARPIDGERLGDGGDRPRAVAPLPDIDAIGDAGSALTGPRRPPVSARFTPLADIEPVGEAESRQVRPSRPGLGRLTDLEPADEPDVAGPRRPADLLALRFSGPLADVGPAGNDALDDEALPIVEPAAGPSNAESEAMGTVAADRREAGEDRGPVERESAEPQAGPVGAPHDPRPADPFAAWVAEQAVAAAPPPPPAPPAPSAVEPPAPARPAGDPFARWIAARQGAEPTRADPVAADPVAASDDPGESHAAGSGPEIAARRPDPAAARPGEAAPASATDPFAGWFGGPGRARARAAEAPAPGRAPSPPAGGDPFSARIAPAAAPQEPATPAAEDAPAPTADSPPPALAPAEPIAAPEPPARPRGEPFAGWFTALGAPPAAAPAAEAGEGAAPTRGPATLTGAEDAAGDHDAEAPAGVADGGDPAQPVDGPAPVAAGPVEAAGEPALADVPPRLEEPAGESPSEPDPAPEDSTAIPSAGAVAAEDAAIGDDVLEDGPEEWDDLDPLELRLGRANGLAAGAGDEGDEYWPADPRDAVPAISPPMIGPPEITQLSGLTRDEAFAGWFLVGDAPSPTAAGDEPGGGGARGLAAGVAVEGDDLEGAARRLGRWLRGRTGD